MKIAFIGAGQMGLGMLSCLLRRGFDVAVFDLSQQAMECATAEGARPVASLAAAATDCEVLITMLPTAEAVRQVYLARDGILEAMPAGGTCIDMSTVDPQTAVDIGVRLAERGIAFMDCPVSGGTPKARAGTLTLMVGGDAVVLERMRPVLEAMAANIVHVGKVGCGAAAKLSNNVIAASSMVATAEAYQIATSFGVDPEVLTRILEASSGNTWVLHNMHPVPGIRPGSPSSNGYKASFTTTNMLEMLDLIRRAAFEKSIPLAIVPAVQAIWQLGANHGYAEKDCTSVYQFMTPPNCRDGTVTSEATH
jgi:3-hydroxyisobutyrate dehydrogenase